MFKILISLLALNASIAFAHEPIQNQNNIIQYSVEAQIIFRPWSTKEFGEVIGTERLTIITTPDKTSDIIILYNNSSSSEGKTETYRSDPDSTIIWRLVSEEQDKSIVKQPGGAFHIHELISGEDGGSRILRFRLRNPSP